MTLTAPPPLRVAAAQLLPPRAVDPAVTAPVDLALRRIADRTVRAGADGVHLLVFPELSLTGYDLDRLDDPESWLVPDDPRLDRLRDLSRQHGVAVVVNAAHRTADGRRLLASSLLHPDGTQYVSGKQHLHGPERHHFDPGTPIAPVELNGWRISLAVCFDAAVPAHAASAAAAGADVYAVSAFYSPDERRRMAIHHAARAMDHRMFAMVANAATRPDLADSCGGSGVWGPDGDVVVRVGTDETVVVATLDPAALARWRHHDRAAVG